MGVPKVVSLPFETAIIARHRSQVASCAKDPLRYPPGSDTAGKRTWISNPFATNEEIRYITAFAKGDRTMSGTISRATLIEWRKYCVHSCQAENSRCIRRCGADFCFTASSSVGDESHYRRATERKAAEVEIGGGSSRR